MIKARRTLQQWQQLMSDWQQSGLSVKEYCQRQQLTPSNFYLWRKRLEILEVDTTLEPWVALSGEPGAQEIASNDWQMELSLPGGVILRMKQGR